MNDLALVIFTLAAPAMAALGLTFSLTRSKQRSLFRRLLGGGFAAMALGIAILVIPFVWVLRDGLAPGMVISRGIAATAHFSFLYALALIPVAVLALVAWGLLRASNAQRVDQVA